MPRYAYKIITPGGMEKSDRLEAASVGDARKKLQESGGHVVRVTELAAGRSQARPGSRRPMLFARRVDLEELAASSRQIAMMVRAGIPFTECLATVSEQARSKALREALAGVALDIQGGRTIGDALAGRAGTFPPIYVSMVKTAERGGNLDEMLTAGADYLKATLETRRRIKSALMYPAIVVVATFGVISFMIGFLMPRFAEMFEQMNVKIPPTTAFLVSLGRFVSGHPLASALPPAGLVAAALIVARNPRANRRASSVLLSLPIIGEMVRKASIARSLRALGALLGAGVSFGQAISAAAESAGTKPIADAFERARKDIEMGAGLSDSLKTSGQFPSLVTQMARVGEKTGEMPQSLLAVTEFYEDEVRARVSGLTAIIEPALVVFLGLVVGLVAVSIISPIYSLVGSLK
jgi:type IV pilus assembly protein PilC